MNCNFRFLFPYDNLRKKIERSFGMQNYYQRPAFRQPYQNRENSREATREINRQKPCDVKDKLRKEFPVAMAYVPWQRYPEPYPVCKGFIRGTIFEELDKPFLGKGGCRL